MAAMLANLDYQNMEIHWAVTAGYFEPTIWDNFITRIRKLMEAIEWPRTVKWHIHKNKIRLRQMLQNYQAILLNKDLLRDLFLDSDCEYFLLLGGDNPPPRRAIKRLLKCKADVAIGVCYQRPGVDKKAGVYPLVWRYLWHPWELKEEEFETDTLKELKLAWIHCPSIMNISFNPRWKKRRNQYIICGGDGCALIRREVLEMIDWGVTPTISYHSEDIHFHSLALWYGYTTCVATDLHVPHMHKDGLVY